MKMTPPITSPFRRPNEPEKKCKISVRHIPAAQQRNGQADIICQGWWGLHGRLGSEFRGVAILRVKTLDLLAGNQDFADRLAGRQPAQPDLPPHGFDAHIKRRRGLIDIVSQRFRVLRRIYPLVHLHHIEIVR